MSGELDYIDPLQLGAGAELEEHDALGFDEFNPRTPHPRGWEPPWTIPPDLYQNQRWGGIANAPTLGADQTLDAFEQLIRVQLPYREARLWNINLLSPTNADGGDFLGTQFAATSATPQNVAPFPRGRVEIMWGHGGAYTRRIYCSWPAGGATYQVHGAWISVSVRDKQSAPDARGLQTRYAANLAPAMVARTPAWWNCPIATEEIGGFGGGVAATPRIIPRGAHALWITSTSGANVYTVAMRSGATVLATYNYTGSANRNVPDAWQPIPIPPFCNNMLFTNGGAPVVGVVLHWLLDIN